MNLDEKYLKADIWTCNSVTNWANSFCWGRLVDVIESSRTVTKRTLRWDCFANWVKFRPIYIPPNPWLSHIEVAFWTPKQTQHVSPVPVSGFMIRMFFLLLHLITNRTSKHNEKIIWHSEHNQKSFTHTQTPPPTPRKNTTAASRGEWVSCYWTTLWVIRPTAWCAVNLVLKCT